MDESQSPLHILMINKFLYEKGGAEIYFRTLADELESKGHTVSFFGIEDEKNTMLNKHGIYARTADFHTHDITEAARYPFRILYSAEAKRKLKTLIDAEADEMAAKDFGTIQPETGFDVVHLGNFNFHLTPSILEAIPDDIPVIYTAHDAQLMCPNHLMYIPKTEKRCQKCVFSGKTGACIRNKCTHGSLVKSILSAAEGGLYHHLKTYERIDKIICPSRFMQELFEQDKRFTGKTVYLPNAVTRREYSGPKEEKDYILYFGRLSPEKGVRNIISVAKALHQIRFVIAGAGDESLLGGMPDNVQYLGFKTGDELNRLIAEARLVVLPSICYENCPLSVIEAQQLGAAVLVPSYGGAAEMTGGPKIENETALSLVTAIQKTYGDDKLIAEMRADSIQRAKKYPTIEEYEEKIEELYRQLIAGKRSGVNV